MLKNNLKTLFIFQLKVVSNQCKFFVLVCIFGNVVLIVNQYAESFAETFNKESSQANC